VIATYVRCNAVSHDKYFVLFTLVLSGITMYVMYYYYYYYYHPHHNHFILAVITVIILVVHLFWFFFLLKYKILNGVMFRRYVMPLYPDRTHKKAYIYSIMAV
jgi:uncharacterized membrane-anchored protein